MQTEVLLSLALAAFSGGLIGWVTNWLAIKALFHPRKPFKFLFFQFQGLLPKRQPELAKNLGRIVEGELVKVDELIKRVQPEDIDPIIENMMRQNRDEIEQKIKDYVGAVANKIPFFNLSADGLVKSILNKLESEICSALKKQVPTMLEHAAEKAAEKISVSEIVHEKVSEMELDKLENLFYKISGTEMQMIIRLGGVIGVLVGIVQWAVQNFVIS